MTPGHSRHQSADSLGVERVAILPTNSIPSRKVYVTSYKHVASGTTAIFFVNFSHGDRKFLQIQLQTHQYWARPTRDKPASWVQIWFQRGINDRLNQGKANCTTNDDLKWTEKLRQLHTVLQIQVWIIPRFRSHPLSGVVQTNEVLLSPLGLPIHLDRKIAWKRQDYHLSWKQRLRCL